MSFKSWIYRPENRVTLSGQGDNFITKAVRKISRISLVIVFFIRQYFELKSKSDVIRNRCDILYEAANRGFPFTRIPS